MGPEQQDSRSEESKVASRRLSGAGKVQPQPAGSSASHESGCGLGGSDALTAVMALSRPSKKALRRGLGVDRPISGPCLKTVVVSLTYRRGNKNRLDLTTAQAIS